IVPHITDEIKRRIRHVGEKAKADVLLTEIGGTTGDIEGLPFLEAIRQIGLEENEQDTLFVHVALVPVLESTGEQKTKPLQHSVNELRRIGIQPDIVIARSSGMIDEESKRKIALFTSVPYQGVFCSPTVQCIYELPTVLDSQGMGSYVVEKLGLQKRQANWKTWNQFLDGFLNPTSTVKVALCGKYAKLADSYVSINEALRHAAASLHVKVDISWIEAEDLEQDPTRVEKLKDLDGILIPPGFGSRGTEGKIIAVQYARQQNLPFLGVCFGSQMAVVEFARNVCGLKGANSTENDPKTPYPVLDFLPEQKELRMKGGTMRLGAHEIHVAHSTTAHRLYGSDVIYGRHRHRYEVNPEYWDALQSHGLVFSGKSVDARRIEIFEYPANMFHMGIQYHPEFKSRIGKPEPMYVGFIKACLERRQRRLNSTS
ncbi:MAG: CTP synthase, partial [Candidatus Bathyarchaeia archaeon]